MQMSSEEYKHQGSSVGSLSPIPSQPPPAQGLPEPGEVSGFSSSQWIYFQSNISQSWVGPTSLFVKNFTFQ